MTINYWRQLDLLPPGKMSAPITVIGAGGIGSPTILALTKMGFNNVTVFDPDTVEDHNIPNQFYRKSDLGKFKVEALKEICLEFSDTCLKTHRHKFNVDMPVHGICISGVDSMRARKEIWALLRDQGDLSIYIDARMGAETGRILSFLPCASQNAWYESTLYSDEDALDVPCTAKAIIYNTLILGGLIASQVKKQVNGESIPRDVVIDMVTMSMTKY